MDAAQHTSVGFGAVAVVYVHSFRSRITQTGVQADVVSYFAIACDYAAMNTLYASYFPGDRLPARTTVGVTGLARGGIVEIDMIARR